MSYNEGLNSLTGMLAKKSDNERLQHKPEAAQARIKELEAQLTKVLQEGYNEGVEAALEGIRSCRDPGFLRYEVSCIYETYDKAIEYAEDAVSALKETTHAIND